MGILSKGLNNINLDYVNVDEDDSNAKMIFKFRAWHVEVCSTCNIIFIIFIMYYIIFIKYIIIYLYILLYIV